ncbi:type II toxin-antitoxin system RelE/ParE family toxin [Rhodoferax sp.]|uniref:type II toxin-antitoxin system RelE/ParE family toxin n=1 Tax=Rhodoferax sp. TaxID=50421 RepID=UPI0025D8745B|nr:type II toxin-antitoxin system RelE/ParE family toxin [Rhodoferax sp.]
MRIFTNTWFSRFARKEKIPISALLDAAQRADQGQIDADLGGGVIKQRIARPGEDKSKGFRSILLFRKGERCIFVFGFPKSDLGNIRDDEEEQFKKMAKLVLGLTDAQLSVLVLNGQFEEVMYDKEIPQ